MDLNQSHSQQGSAGKTERFFSLVASCRWSFFYHHVTIWTCAYLLAGLFGVLRGGSDEVQQIHEAVEVFDCGCSRDHHVRDVGRKG